MDLTLYEVKWIIERTEKKKLWTTQELADQHVTLLNQAASDLQISITPIVIEVHVDG